LPPQTLLDVQEIIASPAFIVMKAADQFKDKTTTAPQPPIIAHATTTSAQNASKPSTVGWLRDIWPLPRAQASIERMA